MARSLLKCQSMLVVFWGEAVATTVYSLNRAPTKVVDDVTPYEAWHGRKLNVHHLCTFRYVAFVMETKPHLKKLDACGT
jgi:hypothetical protein